MKNWREKGRMIRSKEKENFKQSYLLCFVHMTFEVMTQPNEILKAAKALKNGKSAAGDLISNEMIKHGFPVLIEPILKLFNLIFEKGEFPKLWNESYITLLHKKGKQSDPANYRGISLTSNLGKLFNKVFICKNFEISQLK